MSAPDDSVATRYDEAVRNEDRVQVEAVVGTASDQTAAGQPNDDAPVAKQLAAGDRGVVIATKQSDGSLVSTRRIASK